VWKYGTAENLEELRKKSSKLMLCVEMENWEKAEGFADVLRRLTDSAPREIKNAVLRLKMAVQKADYESTETAFEKLKAVLAPDQEI
jgi:predicted negative regulator of RcsB-dependent stress response